jgi:chaperonin GroEL
LATFVVNKLRGGFSVLAVKAPGFGDRKKEMLQDIATMVGAQVISEDLGVKLENATVEMLGRADRVVATKDNTVIVGGRGKKSDIDNRLAQLKKQKEQTESKYDKEKLDERIAKLSGGVAVIKVGAATETEMRYLKLKIEDAVAATKAAISEGVIAGGGAALVRVAKKLRESKDGKPEKLNAEIQLGKEIVMKALEAPLRQIVLNAGKADGSIAIERIINSDKENCGYNAATDIFSDDLIKDGIIDPVKVARAAIENAASAAGILLTTEVAIADEPEKDKPASHNHGGEMDY